MNRTLGYIVTGPASLPKDRQLAYAAAASGLRLLAQAAEDYAEGRGLSPEAEAVLSRTGMDADYDLDDYRTLREEAAKQIVDDLYKAWEHGAEDACSRVDPHNPERMIVFAGGSSDNCGFESGSAYSALREADRLGVLDALNIL